MKELNTATWKKRRKIANKRNVKVSVVSWKFCLCLAKLDREFNELIKKW